MASTGAKKRKRGVGADEDEHRISLQMSAQPSTELGPVLVSFPAVRPPPKTAFECYLRKASKRAEETKDFVDQATFVAGEADTVEFTSHNQIDHPAVGCSYFIAVHNKRTRKTVLRPAPLHLLTRQVKALKGLQNPVSTASAAHAEARTALGQAFGTKKAQAAIRAQERGRVDVSAMEGVAGHLQDTIEENTGALPSQEQAKTDADNARPIPPYNVDATVPGEVYALHDIIPEVELNAITVSSLNSAKTDAARTALLPYSRSEWVNERLRSIFATKKRDKTDIKVLVYISTMFAFRAFSRRVGDKDAVQSRFSSMPSAVVDGLLSRFSETARDSSQAQTTSQTETKLLTHMFALCLRMDRYATNTTVLAADLNMAATQVNQLFKTLGCKISKLTPADVQRLGLPDNAVGSKRAVLTIPLEFPQPRLKRRT